MRQIRALISLAIALALAAPHPSFALPSHFGTVIGAGLLCNDVLDTGFYYNYLSANIERPYKREAGALWFRVNGELFGKNVREIFISDGDSDWVFIGAVFQATPVELAKAVQERAGRVYLKREPANPYSPWVEPKTSEIMWQGRQAKLLCRRLIGPWHYAIAK